MMSKSKVYAKELLFKKAVDAWVVADRECSKTYVAWQQACANRIYLAESKNIAWNALAVARHEAENEEENETH